RWQLGRISAAARAALRQLPPVGENSSGPLGPGLLASGLLGTIIGDLQASLADPDHALPPRAQVDQEGGKKEERPAEVHVTQRLAWHQPFGRSPPGQSLGADASAPTYVRQLRVNGDR